jgi:hypothetical protein
MILDRFSQVVTPASNKSFPPTEASHPLGDFLNQAWKSLVEK